MTGKNAFLTGEILRVVSFAIVTTNRRKSAEGIVVMTAEETWQERRPEQLAVGVSAQLRPEQEASAERDSESRMRPDCERDGETTHVPRKPNDRDSGKGKSQSSL